MPKKSALTLLPLVLAACMEQGGLTDPAITPAFAASAVTTSTSVPIDLAVFVPCANGGSGEVVALSGRLHILTHATLNANGGFTLRSHVQPQNVSGTGQVTGDRYRGTGVTQITTTANSGETFTFINNFRVVGQGPGNNILVHENVHMTVNANGEVTASVANLSVECR